MKPEEMAKALDLRLKRLDYPEIERALANVENDLLIELLDSRSIKIGDSAAGLLLRNKPLVISAILENRISTKLGKIRAKNILFGSGRRHPNALQAYLALLNDRNDEVAGNSLLALVLWGDIQVLPLIKARGMKVKSPKDMKRFELACEALEKSNPAILSPHFKDDKGMWA